MTNIFKKGTGASVVTITSKNEPEILLRALEMIFKVSVLVKTYTTASVLHSFYIILMTACLPRSQQCRTSNMIPLTLGPYGSNLHDIIKVLEPMKALDEDVFVALNFGTS